MYLFSGNLWPNISTFIGKKLKLERRKERIFIVASHLMNGLGRPIYLKKCKRNIFLSCDLSTSSKLWRKEGWDWPKKNWCSEKGSMPLSIAAATFLRPILKDFSHFEAVIIDQFSYYWSPFIFRTIMVA